MGAPIDNRATCQFASLRFGAEGLDDKFRSVVDELEVAYYQFWKQGLAKPFEMFDMLPTPEQSKDQFDMIHGLIWNFYTIAFHLLNMDQPPPKRISEERYRYLRDGDGTLLVDQVLTAAQWIDLPRHALVKSRIKARFETVFGRMLSWP